MQEKFKYPVSTKLFHWLFALSVIGVGALGIYMEGLEKSAFKFGLYDYHKAFGILAILFIFGLLISRRTYTQPEPPADLPKGVVLFATIVKYLLFILAIATILLGFFASSYFPHKETIWFFGLEIPSIFGKDGELSKTLIELHGPVAIALLLFSLIHIAGVLKHRFLDKENDVLDRMI